MNEYIHSVIFIVTLMRQLCTAPFRQPACHLLRSLHMLALPMLALPQIPAEHSLALIVVLHECVLSSQFLKHLFRVLLGAVLGVGVGDGSLLHGLAGCPRNFFLDMQEILTLYPEALFEISSVVPWMLSMGLLCVGMLSPAVAPAVLS